MTITHYYPWERTQRAEQDIRHAFSHLFTEGDKSAAWAPRVDVLEEGNRYVIRADVAGVDPKDIDISADKNVLTIKGERKADSVAEGVKATRVERSFGTFTRSFTLPEGADADAITAAGKHGVLEISIPKKAELAPRKIEITH